MIFQEPSELILARCRAFCDGDFKFIYETYHSQSPFRQLFPDRDDYIRYGRSNLRQEFRIRECRILREETAEASARIIWYMEMTWQGKKSRTLELSFLRRTGKEWQYFGGLKLNREAFRGELEEVDWNDFSGDEEMLL